MRHLLLAAAALVGIEAAAFACSCIATDDPTELRRFATEAAENAIAVVEAEALTSYQATGTGETMQVTQILAGNAPVRFTIHREGSPSSASCDVLHEVGDRSVMILYPAGSPAPASPTFRTSGLCSVHLLAKPVFFETLIKAVGSRTTVAGERG